MNHIITISREFGSGGRTVGKKVAEKLGIPCYDSELIQKIAEESGFAENYVKEAGEYTPGGFLSSALSNRAFGPTNEDILWEIQCRVISELAEKGPCVIVGRCADYILQDKAKCLKVFIHADMAFRAKRIVEVYGEREQSPEQRLIVPQGQLRCQRAIQKHPNHAQHQRAGQGNRQRQTPGDGFTHPALPVDNRRRAPCG